MLKPISINIELKVNTFSTFLRFMVLSDRTERCIAREFKGGFRRSWKDFCKYNIYWIGYSLRDNESLRLLTKRWAKKIIVSYSERGFPEEIIERGTIAGLMYFKGVKGTRREIFENKCSHRKWKQLTSIYKMNHLIIFVTKIL